MKKYCTKKYVEAATIVRYSISASKYVLDDDSWVFGSEMGNFNRPKYVPKLGDYVVRYPDGYLAWCPKDTFEESATEV
jgi:hypothetical protein